MNNNFYKGIGKTAYAFSNAILSGSEFEIKAYK